MVCFLQVYRDKSYVCFAFLAFVLHFPAILIVSFILKILFEVCNYVYYECLPQSATTSSCLFVFGATAPPPIHEVS
jgi:hypothetical protein